MAPKAAGKAAKAPKPAGTGKGKSAYNDYMKTEISRLKAANPSLEHKVAFKQAAANWSKDKPAK